MGHRGVLDQWKYYAWYQKDGNVSLYICLNNRMYNTKSER